MVYNTKTALFLAAPNLFFVYCKRLFDSFILVQHVLLFNSTLCVCGRNPRPSNPSSPIQGKQMTFRPSALLNRVAFPWCRKNGYLCMRNE